MFVIFLPSHPPQLPSTFNNSAAPAPLIPFQGASSLEELGNRLHETLRNGTPENIRPYLLNQQVYDKLLKDSDAQLRETLQLLSPEDIADDFERELATLVTDGLAAEINWAQTTPGDVSGMQGAKAQHVIPATLIVSDQHNRQIEINFEAVKVNDRYYFFQQVRLGR